MESIRRIIREEIDGLGWINKIKPKLTKDLILCSNHERFNPGCMEILNVSDRMVHTKSLETGKRYADSITDIMMWLTDGDYLLMDKINNHNLNENDDLQWIKENPIEVGKCFRIYDWDGNVDAIVTIKEMEQREWKDNIRQKGGKFNPDDIIIHLVGVTQKDKERVGPNYRISYNDLVDNINNGFEVPTDCGNSINESDDLQWIKDIKPIPELKIGTCFIDVMDSTKTEWIIIDFKMTPGGTHIVVIKNKKNNVDIRHMHEEYFEQDLLNGRYKPC